MAELNANNTLRFNSIYELGEHVAHLQANIQKGGDGARPNGVSSTNDYGVNTCGLTLDQAIDCAKTGGHWQEGADLMPCVHAAHERLNGDPLLTPSLENNVQGFAPNVPNYLCGLPDSMMDFVDDLQGEKLIRVGVHVGRTYDTTQNQIMNRGAAIMAVLDQLSKEGYSIELTALWRNTDGEDIANVETIIKHGCDHWAPESVAFALCHAAFQRRLCWRTVESMPEQASGITRGGYGNGRGVDLSEFDVSFGYVTKGWLYDNIDNAVEKIKRETIEQLANNERLAA